MRVGALLLLAAAVVAGAEVEHDDARVGKGPHAVGHAHYTYSKMDSTSKRIDVYYPSDAGSQQFPLISFAHGMSAQDPNTAYPDMFKGIASWGYILAATSACKLGCKDDPGPPEVPNGFSHYYKQQLKMIEWARGEVSDAVLKNINRTIGAGIAGHSMGGQATMFSSGGGNPEKYNIAAAVMMHAFTNKYQAPTVPFLAFTGTTDTLALPSMTKGFYNKAAAGLPRGYANKVGAGHMEPTTGTGRPALIMQYTVAWFKLFLDRTPQYRGTDFHEMIFGSGKASLCHGGDGNMKECKVVPGRTPPAPAPPAPAPGGARYHCDTLTRQCVAADSGHSTIAKCEAACAAPAPPGPAPPAPAPPAPATFACVSGACVADASGVPYEICLAAC